MKKILIGCLLPILLLTACSAVRETTSPTIPGPDLAASSTPLTPTAVATPLDSLEETLKKQLAANLSLEEGVISVTGNSEVQFADSCLEVPMKDVKCGPGPVTGRVITLQALGLQYEYHVASDGNVIQPASRVLDWSRTGGAQNLCDHLTVFLSGEVYGSRCQADPDRVTSTLADLLSREELNQFDRWVREYGQVQLDASDPEDAAERLEILLQFYVGGDRTPGQAEQEELLGWAQSLFQRMFP
jgi:hypothetical protein